jgi:cytochrome P450
MRRDPVGFVMRCAREYGDVVHVRLSPWSMFLFAHPRDVRHILQDHHKNYWKGPFLGKLKRIAGEGLVFSDGDAEPVPTLRPRPSLLMTIHRRG